MTKPKAVSVASIQRLDRMAMEQYGIPSIVLMENAGRCVSQEIFRVLKHKQKKNVIVICGVGNNAGDGFVAARHLVNGAVSVKVFLVGTPSTLKLDAKINYQILQKSAVRVYPLDRHWAEFEKSLKDCQVVVDALLGVGLNRRVEGLFKKVIETIRASGKYVVAVDIPSGLDGTTGTIYGSCIRANTTVTMSLSKKGFYQHNAHQYTGKIVVADIGIPRRLIKRIV
jgi:NAD(P)H-hydrate epimerase